MPAPEEFVVNAAHHATIALRSLWQRHRNSGPLPSARLLANAKPRLELLIEAVLGQHLPIREARPEAPASLLRRLFNPRPRPPESAPALPGNDGEAIYLPAHLAASSWGRNTMEVDEYSLLALLQAIRCQRGSATHFTRADEGVTADLYLLAEAVAVDQSLRHLLPGWGRSLDSLYARTEEYIARHRPRCEPEAEVVALYAAFLKGSMRPLPLATTPAAALGWARAYTEALGARYPRHRYQPWLGDLVIGRLLIQEAKAARPEPAQAQHPPSLNTPPGREPKQKTISTRIYQADIDSKRTASPINPRVLDDFKRTLAAAPPFLDGQAAEHLPKDLFTGTSAFQIQTAQICQPSASGHTMEAAPNEEYSPSLEASQSTTDNTPGFSYPEWNHMMGGYQEGAVHVYVSPARQGEIHWVHGVLERHAGLLREVRRRLGAIRPERQIQKRQLEGDDIDCDALIGERSEHRAGVTPAGAFYQTRLPAPRRIGIVLLIDASASTDTCIEDGTRIMDVEKEAALVAATALDTARIDFSVLAFSGIGPRKVEMQQIKTFDAPWEAAAQCRIAGLEPELYTRLGAALRHASALLARQPVDHRLLLLFSDGRPNDCDRYAGHYGIEDARQALAEARLQQIAPYCLTVDREGSAYLPTLFGSGHYTIVQRPQQLPVAFLEWLKQATRRCRN